MDSQTNVISRARTPHSAARSSSSLPARAVSNGEFRALAGLVLALGVALRMVGASKDLWLDEVWSVQVAGRMSSPFAALTLHHEINHYLNTMWLYALGSGQAALAYHLPALLAGAASIVVAGLIGLRRDRTTALFMILLFGTSYELVLYSSEARGYSTAVLFSLVCFYCLESITLGQDSVRWRVAYSASAVLGLLSHPIFVSVIIAGVAWTLFDQARAGGIRRALWPVARIHGVALTCFLVLYLVDLRFVVAGGGTPARSLIDAYGTSFAWTFGTLPGDAAMLVSCMVCLVLLESALRRLSNAGVRSWVYFSAAIVAPVILILARRSDWVYVRHFLIGTVFALTAVAMLLAALWRGGRRALVAVLVAGYVGLNGWHIVELAVRGRGQYRAAIKYIVDHTPGSTITIGGDQDFRIGTELSYYLPAELGLKRATYVAHTEWPAKGPQWLIAQRESSEPVLPADEQIRDPAGNEFELAEIFPSAPLSGLHWYVYRNRSLP